MKSKYLQINNTAWYYLFIYYSRNNWYVLLSDINTFYENNKENFDFCLIFFSEDRGEHIKIVFRSKLNFADSLESEINNHFQLFLNQNPSFYPKEFPFGKGIWCYYPNNTLHWKKFDFKGNYIVFSEKLISLVPFLLEEDMSIDNLFSVALFLSVKMLKQIDHVGNVNKIIETMEKDIDDVYNTQIETFKIDFLEISQIIDLYWTDEKQDSKCKSLLYREWETEIRKILYITSIDSNYTEIVLIMCDHLGLSKSYYFMILNFIKEWYILKRVN